MNKLDQRDNTLSRLIFWSVLILEFLAGYYLCHVRGYLYGDAVSRVANSFYVLYIYPPHLAAMGGVWNPLPSLFELPFMLIWRIYKPIATSGLAGVVFSSLSAAGSAWLIYRNTVRFGRSVLTAISLAFLYCLHPFMFIYGANGMTEVPFSMMILWFGFSLTQWMEEREPFLIVKMALALMVAFLIRYEAIPLAVAAFLAVAISTMTLPRNSDGLDWKYVWRRVEGESIILLTPVVYAFIIWVLFCWIVLGDPLYFMNSAYSITAFAKEYAADATLKSLMGDIGRTLRFVFLKTELFLIPLGLILIFRCRNRKAFQWDILILLILTFSTTALQVVNLWRGLSAGWLRYFIYPFPFLIAWLPYEMKKVSSRIFTLLCVLLLIFADVAMAFAWFDPSPKRLAPEEFNNLKFRGEIKDLTQADVARYINHNLPNASIMMDSVKTYLVIMNSDHPWNFIIPCSRQFDKALVKPRRYKVDYILLPSTTDTDPFSMDVINKRYPDLYRYGASWCVPVKEFGKYYKLYKVIK